MLLARPWRVLEIAADPFRWARSLQLLGRRGVAGPGVPAVPGQDDPGHRPLLRAGVNRQLTHSGDSRLACHVANAVLGEDARGARLAKERKDSPRRIDATSPPSWPTTGPLPWPAPPGTVSTSARATTPGASRAPVVVARTRLPLGARSPGSRWRPWMRGTGAHPTTDPLRNASNTIGVTIGHAERPGRDWTGRPGRSRLHGARSTGTSARGPQT
jgi:hypothetical protein